MPLIYKFCETCGARYGTFRSQRKHCSNACRQRAYRNAHSTVQPDETILTLQFGNITVKVVDLDPACNKESLRQTIIDTLGPELTDQVSELGPPVQDAPQTSERHPAVIVFEDGWTQQANLTVREVLSLPGTQRLAGSILRTIKEIR